MVVGVHACCVIAANLLIGGGVSILPVDAFSPLTFQSVPLALLSQPPSDGHAPVAKTLIEFVLKNGHESMPSFTGMDCPR
jgi:hypothetical protein